MKKYHSLEELTRSCSNSSLESMVRAVLGMTKYIKWDLVSCSVEDDVGKADFVSPIEKTNLVRRLSCETNKRGQFGHMEITELTPAVASMKL